MIGRPKHLSEQYASQYKDKCMAEVYDKRPPYPDQVFDILLNETLNKRFFDGSNER